MKKASMAEKMLEGRSQKENVDEVEKNLRDVNWIQMDKTYMVRGFLLMD